MYRPKHFILQELVAPEIYAERGDRAWELLQPPALRTLDLLREKFGPMVVNNWHDNDGTIWLPGKVFKESGLRSFKTSTGAEWSMHRFGGAFDPKFKDATPQEVHAYVLAHPGEFPEITAVENIEATPTWFHYDVRNHRRAGIWVVNP